MEKAKRVKNTYCLANFHLKNSNSMGVEEICEEGARLISIDDEFIVIASSKYAISLDLIKNVFIALVCGNNSRVIFSATPYSVEKKDREAIYKLKVPEKKTVKLPNGKEYECVCQPVTKYQEIKKSKNPLGRNAWDNGQEEVLGE